jgi:hypothetical protein
MTSIYVFGNDDLRKYIFSYLRKKPKIKCDFCNRCLVWDKKVYKYFQVPLWDFSNCNNLCKDCYNLPIYRLSDKLIFI